MDPVSTKARHFSSPTRISVSFAWPSRSHMGLFDESMDDDVVDDDDTDGGATSCCPLKEVSTRLKASSCFCMPGWCGP